MLPTNRLVLVLGQAPILPLDPLQAPTLTGMLLVLSVMGPSRAQAGPKPGPRWAQAGPKPDFWKFGNQKAGNQEI